MSPLDSAKYACDYEDQDQETDRAQQNLHSRKK
jgi:hypothetical protein